MSALRSDLTIRLHWRPPRAARNNKMRRFTCWARHCRAPHKCMPLVMRAKADTVSNKRRFQDL